MVQNHFIISYYLISHQSYHRSEAGKSNKGVRQIFYLELYDFASHSETGVKQARYYLAEYYFISRQGV